MEQEVETKILKQKKDFKKALKDSIPKIAIFVISIVYITQGIFQFVKKDSSLLEILGNITIATILGLTLSDLFRKMGLKDGKKDTLYVESLKAYGKVKADATPYFDRLSSWCDYKNVQELEEAKKDIIQRAGLNWKAYKFGYYKEHNDKLTNDQIDTIHKADKCKIAKLYSQELLSDFSKSRLDKNKFGQDVGSYAAKDFTSETLGKILTGVVFGLYGLAPIVLNESAISGMLWNMFQIGMWLVFGIIKYFNAFSFIVDEYRQSHIISKTEYLNEFIITMQNNPDVIKQYGDEVEIDKYIEEFIKEREAQRNGNKDRDTSTE